MHAAEPTDSSEAGTKHITHRASTDDSRVGKASRNRSTRVSAARSHGSHRASAGNGRSRNRQRNASNQDAPRAVNGIQPDANIQVQLPRNENDNDNENQAENDDKSSILLGGATENGDGERP